MTPNLLTEQCHPHLDQIEWNWLKQIIAQFCYFDKTKEVIFQSFYSNSDSLDLEFSKISNYEHFFDPDKKEIFRNCIQNLGASNHIEKYISALSKDSYLNISEINSIVKLFEACLKILNSFETTQIDEINFIRNNSSIAKIKSINREFRFLVDIDSSINFEKHPELNILHKRLRDLEEKIRKSIQETLINPQFSKILQFSSYDLIYDRYVIPIRSDSYRAELGIIISRSETGQTLFVEPYELRELSNKRLEAIAKIDEIINKIAENFSKQLHPISTDIHSLYWLLIQLDTYHSKSNFHSTYHLNRPQIRSEVGFSFNNLSHPLIKNCVKNDVTCASNIKGIIISGPNTGGKTVFLKSITLSYLLFYHGFFVPADQAELYPYKGLFYFGNDLQNLSSGLSSFSGEVNNYLSLLNYLCESNLILIDEIFNSTSSDEASALSLAYFEKLHSNSNCHLIVSTHHQMFKTLIHQNENYLSCHVGFDTNELKPTYKIIWGTPGSSMAIEIFKILSSKMALSHDIAINASKLMDNKNISYETLLQKVTQKQIELDKTMSSMKKIEHDLKNQKGSMEGILQLKMNEELGKTKKELEKIISQAKDLFFQIKNEEIQKIKKIEEKEFSLKKQLSSVVKNEIHPISPNIPRESLNFKTLKSGDEVFSHEFKKNFRVLSIDFKKEEVTIGKGSFKISVAGSTLSKPTHKEQKSKVQVFYSKSESSTVEIDARGMRLSEFQSLVDKSLGDLLSGDIPFLSIIHGHGDGILKNWLRDHLKKSSDFKGETPESGNDGETKITLK